MLLSKALVPVANMLNDIGLKQAKPLEQYMEPLNDSLRLMAAAFNFLNQTRKEISRIYVREMALGQLCKWDHEVGQDALFPFDVSKKCDELNNKRPHWPQRANFQSHSYKWPKKHQPTSYHNYSGYCSSGPYSKPKKGYKTFFRKKVTGQHQQQIQGQIAAPANQKPQQVGLSSFDNNFVFKNTLNNFTGGKIAHSVSMWKSLTTDNWIISVILGKIIELEELPV